MITKPQKRISKRGLKVWRIAGAIHSIFALLAAAAAITLTVIFQWPFWIIGAALIAFAAYAYTFIMLVPSIKWKHWRYEVRENEIEIQHGVFVITSTLIPMIRVQHVDTQQGPILRKYRLATVAISTAATVHEIPALDVDEAEELRFFISNLARVAVDDV